MVVNVRQRFDTEYEIEGRRGPSESMQRAAIYNYGCCMSSAPFGHTTGIQVRRRIRLDMPRLRLYRALAVPFVMAVLL